MWQAHPADLDELDSDPVDDEFDDGPMRPMLVSQGPAGAADRQNRAAILAGQAARRAPYLAATATAATGFGAWKFAEAAATHGQPALSGAIILGTCVVTGAGLPVLRFQFRDRTGIDGCTVQRIPRDYRRRWWACGGAAALWIDAMALGATNVIGPDGMAAILLAGAAWLSARWMRDHDIEPPSDTPPPVPPAAEPAPEPEPDPEPVRFPAPPPPDDGDLIAERWDTRVADGPNPIAPRSQLGDDRADLPYGYQWVVQLDPLGNIGCTGLRGRAEDIALRLEVRSTHVLVDHLEGDDNREDRALLTVITRDALKEGVSYRGPVYNDGLIPLGKYADGGGSPNWVTRDATGPQHGMVTGGSRSGKSELLARLGMAMKYSREWVVLFGDGDEQGRSSPLLKRIAYDFARGPEVLEQLEALEAWFHARGSIMGGLTEDADSKPIPMTDPDRQEPARKILPCRAFPGFVWIIDEFHRLVKKYGRAFVERVAALVRIIGKAGGAVYIGTQSATVEDFGGDDVFRGQLAQGNCVILRTKNSTEAYVVTDFGCDPGLLPKGGGYGYVDDDGRQAMFRGEYSDHMARWVRALPDYRPDELAARVYASKRPPTPADPVADYEETQQRKAAILAALEAGEPLPWEEQSAPPEEQPPTGAVGGDGAAAPVPSSPPPGGLAQWTMGGVGIAQPILGPMFDGTATAQPAAPEPARRPLNGSERAVLDRLVAGGGPIRNQRIIADTGLSDSVVAKALRELTDRGYALRRGQGLHDATAAGRAEAATSTTKETTVGSARRAIDPADVPAEAREFWTGWATCPGCSAEPGANHDSQCDHAMCPECGLQRIQCGEHGDSTRPARWHGVHPWCEIADQMGWWTTFPDAVGGVAPDSGRVQVAEARGELVWVPESQRYAGLAPAQHAGGAP